MEKTWNILTAGEAEVSALQEALQINKHLCKILVQRQICDYESARNYFRPSLDALHSPWLMKDMRKAVNRILQAMGNREKILVYGDYDVDGTTSVACMYRFLRSIHESASFYIPHRYREGYGISKAGIDFAANNGYTLVISLDCGIKSTELIGYAKNLGVDFIVCDHHLPDAELPPAVAILNPKQKDCTYPYKELCGCGVGFKLITALAEELQLQKELVFEYLDLVATAIAADIVPMTGENRILAFHGLKKANENPCPGILALKECSGITKPMNINTLVFAIAPRINAAGRMDDARKAVELFIENDREACMELARLLQSNNSDRREVDSSITEEALELINEQSKHQKKNTTVLFKATWHKGVVGIVASRLIEKHYRPTIVLTESNGFITGSARSVAGFNLYEAIHQCRDLLLGYGGHYFAAGLTLLPEQLTAFTEKFESVVSDTIQPASLIPEIIVDATIHIKDITAPFYKIIQQMEPFGPLNMRPVFRLCRVRDTGYSRIVKEEHLKISITDGNQVISGIGFGLAEKYEWLKNNKEVDILFTIDENEWNNQVSLQIKLIDLKPSA